MSRYEVSGQQNTYQEGSEGEVLANKLGIVRRQDMDEAELILLRKLYFSVLREHPVKGPITVRLIREWHRRWLGNLYPWAGFERSVNMSKDGFPFAAADRIPGLLEEFERRHLSRYTPCTGMNRAALEEAIAVTHVEFILIHPFREGNGRLSRMMADVMAGQAGWGPLDYSSWEADRTGYIHAIQSGMAEDYAPMCAKVGEALGPAPV
ncbi:Fic/DOC family protein [Castellaniella sp. S9]|uniref:Fic/DOC family protein n=1 Tax=Castellaniella sp. S9 TaxID=2993652 RepID=UPI0022B45AC6|nr:Fic family protein [Castellaniella sp. S9]